MQRNDAVFAGSIPEIYDSHLVPLMFTPAVFSAPLTRLSAVILSRLTLGVAAVKRQPLLAQVLLLAFRSFMRGSCH